VEVTIHYGFHPLRGQSLEVIRKYDFLDEVHYVVRRVDGRPLAVAAWMTQPESAGATVVSAGRLPIRTLLDMLRVAEVGLSSRVHNVHEEDRDATQSGKPPTPTLRGGAAARSRRLPAAGCTGKATPSSGALPPGAGQKAPRGKGDGR